MDPSIPRREFGRDARPGQENMPELNASLLSYEAALERILAIPFAPTDELTPLSESCGRVLAVAPSAPFALPRFTQSSMDGVALRAEETTAATPERPMLFPIAGESAAGHPVAAKVPPGAAVRISTGARVPEELDAVIPIERVAIEGVNAVVREPVHAGQFIRSMGEDIAAGAPLLPVSTRIGPAQLAYLATFNLPHVTTFVPPRVGILSSGDEVRMLGDRLGETDIIGSSLYYLENELRACSCEPRIIGISPDDPAKFRRMLGEALVWSDIVVTTAGVSVGEHDVVGRVLGEMNAKVLFWRLNVRPGKPMLVATIGGKVLFGLPGNPVSTICNAELFIKPFLRKAFGSGEPVPHAEKQRLGGECARDAQRLFFVYGRRDSRGGRTIVSALPRQSSANIANPAMADGLIVVPPGAAPLHSGEIVDWIPLKSGL